MRRILEKEPKSIPFSGWGRKTPEQCRAEGSAPRTSRENRSVLQDGRGKSTQDLGHT